ncbi:hypothetical protein Egran_01807 [Elaphomyces granulatus]|uniref:SPX domain-containing protein n=1 Tax=Elaphomyces granulatus TaxID=519963 RepID=A0A232M1Z5_9EURO|nr:hypothetical protein Egran_01807 [Elaphomyces granulatus]
MLFGKTLENSIYPPWKDKYIDYHKLKLLLRERDETGKDLSDNESQSWTEQDEEAFVQELINVQLDKVNAFQAETSLQLRDRTSACEAKLGPMVPKEGAEEPSVDDEKRMEVAAEVLEELNGITKEVSELEKYSRLNFTGFLKAAKKHDRKRGARYRVRPLLQVRLSQLPFNSEDYSPLLNRLSAMYTFVRQVLSKGLTEVKDTATTAGSRFGHDTYTSHKFWVHSDNVMEVKTYILRQLPVLLYNPTGFRELDVSQPDPTITSLYFDNPQFELYNQKVIRAYEAGSLRLRWTGQLKDKPALFLEKKIITDDDHDRDVRVQLKEKHVMEFLNGEYKLEKKLLRMKDHEPQQAELLKKDVEEVQSFIKQHDLQPMLRANYTRTAFQIPGNDRIRISLDTNLALIREDSLDAERPYRDPADWHRKDIDDDEMEYPFGSIGAGEIVRFPHAVLEIKLKTGARHIEWLKDLMVSHLVKEAPRFSKIVHGVAQLFEDHVNTFPFWLGELENDIHRDPATAFQEEQERLAMLAEEQMAVGSFLGSKHSPPSQPLLGSPLLRLPGAGSPVRPGASNLFEPSSLRISSEPPSRVDAEPQGRAKTQIKIPTVILPTKSSPVSASSSRFSTLISSLSTSRYARARRGVSLPPGIRVPSTWIKDSGPVRVESKVWLANQRTFLKWQSVSVLLASLSLALYNSAGGDNDIARVLAIVYTGFAVFSAAWGWYMYEMRARLIRQRSGRDLDNLFGPVIVCIGLAGALLLNFGMTYHAALEDLTPSPSPSLSEYSNTSHSPEAWGLINQAGH